MFILFNLNTLNVIPAFTSNFFSSRPIFFSHRHTSFFQPLIFSRHIYISIRPHILFYFLSFFLSHSYPSHIYFFLSLTPFSHISFIFSLSLTPFSLILDPECMCYAPSTIAISALLLTFSKLHLGRLIQIVIFIFLIMKRFQIYLIYLNFQIISYF